MADGRTAWYVGPYSRAITETAFSLLFIKYLFLQDFSYATGPNTDYSKRAAKLAGLSDSRSCGAGDF